MILHMLHCKNVSNCRTIAVRGRLEGRGTLRFSITLLIGCTNFDFFFRVPDFIDCVRYRSKTTSIRLNLTPFAVSATDTDVFLLLLHHAYRMDIKIWISRQERLKVQRLYQYTLF
jgi:hypothetical protein